MPTTKLNPIQELNRRLGEQLSEAETRITAPALQNGSWWLDAQHDGHLVTVEWRPGKGFGLSAGDAGFGEGPDEIYAEIGQALARLIELLKTKQDTQPPDEVRLGRLRQLRNLTQEKLAEMMGIKQATLSKLERQPDMRLKTLTNVIQALGGSLELWAAFPEGKIKLLLGEQQPAKPLSVQANQTKPRRRTRSGAG